MRHTIIHQALDLPSQLTQVIIKYDWMYHHQINEILKGHKHKVTDIIVNDNKIISTAWQEKSVRMWHPSDVLNIWMHVLRIKALSNKRLMTFHDTNVKIWDLVSKDILLIIGVDFVYQRLFILPDDTIVIYEEPNLNFIDPNNGHKLMSLVGHTDRVNCFIAMGDKFISGSNDCTIKIWVADECIATLTNHTEPVTQLLALGDGRFVSTSLDNTLRIWKDNICESVLSGYTSIKIIIFKGIIISANTDNTIIVWNGKKVISLIGHTDTINDISMLPNNQLISVSKDRTQRVWNIQNRYCVSIFDTGYTHNNQVIIWNNKVVVDWGNQICIFE